MSELWTRVMDTFNRLDTWRREMKISRQFLGHIILFAVSFGYKQAK